VDRGPLKPTSDHAPAPRTVVLGAVLEGQDVAGWIVGLAAGVASVVLAALIWSSRQLWARATLRLAAISSVGRRDRARAGHSGRATNAWEWLLHPDCCATGGERLAVQRVEEAADRVGVPLAGQVVRAGSARDRAGDRVRRCTLTSNVSCRTPPCSRVRAASAGHPSLRLPGRHGRARPSAGRSSARRVSLRADEPDWGILRGRPAGGPDVDRHVFGHSLRQAQAPSPRSAPGGAFFRIVLLSSSLGHTTPKR
jgi:hypothetical protein